MNGRTDKTYNAGIGLLKIVMSFEVVLCHFWDLGENSLKLWQYPFKLMLTWAVPCFIIISFYYGAKIYIESNLNKFIKRIYRLIMPHIVWTFIYLILFMIMELLFHKQYIKNINDIFWQLFLGHSASINSTMWFQIDLAIMTFIFWVIVSIFKNTFYKIIIIIPAICLFFEYTGLNYTFFVQFRREISFPAGRICECLPFACCGMCLYAFGIFEKYKKHNAMWTTNNFIMLIFLLLMRKMNILFTPEGFGYSGIYLILVSVIIVCIFYNLFPVYLFSDRKNNSKFIEFIHKLNFKSWSYLKIVSQYTMGIYFSHRIVGILLNEILIKFGGDDPDSFIKCIAIYIISLTLSMLISGIPLRFCKEIV